MKKTLLLIVLFFFALITYAQVNSKAEIKEATVFLNRALLTNTAQAELQTGINTVIISNISPFIDPQSLQVSGKGNFTIIGVKYTHDYVAEKGLRPEVQVLEDSLEYYTIELEKVKNRKDVLLKEEQMILSNQSIKGQNNNVTVTELKNMADFFRNRLSEVKEKQLEADRTIKKLDERISEVKLQLNEINAGRNQHRGRILVSVDAKRAGAASLDFTYVVNNAGWSPIYDLRVQNTESPVKLIYKANVYQHSGLSWDNVKLTLSTGNPALGGNKPDLYPQYINFQQEYGKRKSRKASRSDALEEVEVALEIASPAPPEAETAADYTQVTETTFTMEYNIGLPYSIPTGGRPELVEIQHQDIKAEYRYATAPKAEQAAFLVARIIDWEQYNLISGNTNIYFEGNFVGESYLDAQNTEDTLQFSLGRDKNIIVERKQIKDFTKKTFLGLNKKETYAYEITVRNTKKVPVSITIEDQVPLSQNKQIEVEREELSGGQVDEQTGKISWMKDLKPSETIKLQIRYTVKYPKDKHLTGL